jgi:hypothetical protein
VPIAMSICSINCSRRSGLELLENEEEYSMSRTPPNTACTRLLGFAALKRVVSTPERFPYNELSPRPPTSG